MTYAREVSVEMYTFLFASLMNWQFDISSVSLSITFDKIGNSEIGLLIAGTSGYPSLGIGTTCANFHGPEKVLCWKELLSSCLSCDIASADCRWKLR